MATIKENIIGVLKRARNTPIVIKRSIWEEHQVTHRIIGSLNSPIVPLKMDTYVPNTSIPVVKLTDKGEYVDITPKGYGIAPLKINAVGQANWNAASFSDIGHTDGLPNYMIGTSVIFVPQHMDEQKNDIIKTINKFAPVGVDIYVETYEEH